MRLKIATWNFQSDKPRTRERESALRRAVEHVSADVWVLTETWADYLPTNGYRVVAQSEPADDLRSWPDQRWVAICARAGLDAECVAVVEHGDRLASARIRGLGGRAVAVVGTVLPWLGDGLWPGAAGFCAALAAQSREWERLRRRAPADDFVLAGDFNQSLPYRRFYGSHEGGRALNDALRGLDLVCLTRGERYAEREAPHRPHLFPPGRAGGAPIPRGRVGSADRSGTCHNRPQRGFR